MYDYYRVFIKFLEIITFDIEKHYFTKVFNFTIYRYFLFLYPLMLTMTFPYTIFL